MQHPVAVRTERDEVLKRLSERLLQVVALIHEERATVMNLDVPRASMPVGRPEVELAGSAGQTPICVGEVLQRHLTQPS